MKYKTLFTSIFGMSFVTALLAGCGAPATQFPTPIPPALTSIPPVTSTPNILSQILTMGDYQYVMECSGEGSPVVLLLGGQAAAWKPIQAEINRFTRTCVFDHMGSNSTPLTAEQIAKNLQILLEDAEMAAPYVLVGFSVGGFIARLFANLYPDEVAGIALLDSSHEDQNARFLTALPPEPLNECQELKDYRIELQGSHLIPIGSEINLDFEASADQVRAKKQNLSNMPMVILTAGRSEWPDCFPPEVRENLDQAWLEMQNDLASLSANSTHLIAKESGHNFAEQPEMVIDAIQQAVEAARVGEGRPAP